MRDRMSAKSRNAVTLACIALLGLLAPLNSLAAQDDDALGPFRVQYAYDVKIPNPGAGITLSLIWRIELIPITPNTEPVLGRTIIADRDVYDSFQHDLFARGAHIIVVLEGTVAIDSPHGSGTFEAGEGTVLDAMDDESPVVDHQYRMSNPSANCATVLRVSSYGIGGMAGVAPRPSSEIPTLSTSCGDEMVVFSGATGEFGEFNEDEVRFGITELWSAGFQEAGSPPWMTMNHDSLLVVQKGLATVDVKQCDECLRTSMELFPPSSLSIRRDESVTFRPSYTRDTRILLLAVHAVDDTPALYRLT